MQQPRSNRGFTLIEILVVIVIVATILSMTVLSIGLVGDDSRLETEGQRFTALLEVLNDEASMQGREFGIEVMSTGYRFVEYDPFGEQWADVPFDDTFRPRELPEGLEFELYIEDKRIQLETAPQSFGDPDDPDKDSDYAPHLLVYSSGDVTPFELHIWRQTLNARADDPRVVLRGDALGMVEIVDQDEL